MKRIFVTLALAVAAAMLTGCDVVDTMQRIEDAVVGNYTQMQDGIVSSWNGMVDSFVDDAPLYGL